MLESASTEGQRRQRRVLSAEGVLFFCVVLYLRVSPSVLLLEVWGRRGNGRELSSQDLAPLSASPPAGDTTQSVNVNLLTKLR